MSEETFKVFIEGNYAGDAPTLGEADRLARQMAFRMGFTGPVNIRVIDDKNQIRARASIYVS